MAADVHPSTEFSDPLRVAELDVVAVFFPDHPVSGFTVSYSRSTNANVGSSGESRLTAISHDLPRVHAASFPGMLAKPSRLHT